MFQKALEQSTKKLFALKESGAIDGFAVIGAFALARVATPRATGDIDYIIGLGSHTLEELAAELNGNFTVGDFSDPLMGSVSFTETGISIQLLQFPPAWEACAFHELQEQLVEKTIVPFVSWKALLLLKLYAASALDIEDARQILLHVDYIESDLEDLNKKASRLRVSIRLSRLLESLESS